MPVRISTGLLAKILNWYHTSIALGNVIDVSVLCIPSTVIHTWLAVEFVLQSCESEGVCLSGMSVSSCQVTRSCNTEEYKSV